MLAFFSLAHCRNLYIITDGDLAKAYLLFFNVTLPVVIQDCLFGGPIPILDRCFAWFEKVFEQIPSLLFCFEMRKRARESFLRYYLYLDISTQLLIIRHREKAREQGKALRQYNI